MRQAERSQAGKQHKYIKLSTSSIDACIYQNGEQRNKLKPIELRCHYALNSKHAGQKIFRSSLGYFLVKI